MLDLREIKLDNRTKKRLYLVPGHPKLDIMFDVDCIHQSKEKSYSIQHGYSLLRADVIDINLSRWCGSINVIYKDRGICLIRFPADRINGKELIKKLQEIEFPIFNGGERV